MDLLNCMILANWEKNSSMILYVPHIAGVPKKVQVKPFMKNVSQSSLRCTKKETFGKKQRHASLTPFARIAEECVLWRTAKSNEINFNAK